MRERGDSENQRRAEQRAAATRPDAVRTSSRLCESDLSLCSGMSDASCLRECLLTDG